MKQEAVKRFYPLASDNVLLENQTIKCVLKP